MVQPKSPEDGAGQVGHRLPFCDLCEEKRGTENQTGIETTSKGGEADKQAETTARASPTTVDRRALDGVSPRGGVNFREAAGRPTGGAHNSRLALTLTPPDFRPRISRISG